MVYTITAVAETGQPVAQEDVRGEQRAAQRARKLAAEQSGRARVFVSWSRASDGQRGYLNPGGHHEITGRAW